VDRADAVSCAGEACVQRTLRASPGFSPAAPSFYPAAGCCGSPSPLRPLLEAVPDRRSDQIREPDPPVSRRGGEEPHPDRGDPLRRSPPGFGGTRPSLTTVSIRSTNRLPLGLCVPKLLLRHNTAPRSARSEA
jgi:hypothetical protein